MKPKEIGRKVWLNLLKNKQQSIHFSLGEVADQILQDAFNNISTKNVSIIIIGFGNMLSCLETNEELALPFMDKIEKLPEN